MFRPSSFFRHPTQAVVDRAGTRSLKYRSGAALHIFDLGLQPDEEKRVLQEAQFHSVKDNLLHVDFLEVIAGKPVTMSIPVKTTGTSPGVRNGGKLNKKLKTLKVKGLVEKMPDTIDIAIDTLEIGQGVRVSDIKIDGLTFLNAANVTVVSVQVTRATVEEPKTAAPVAAAAAAPAAAAAAKPAAKK